MLHSSKHLPTVQTVCVLFQSCQLVWLGSLDLLELGMFACAAGLRTNIESCFRVIQSQCAHPRLTLSQCSVSCAGSI